MSRTGYSTSFTDPPHREHDGAARREHDGAARRAARGAAAALLLFAGPALLGGCGFEPVHGQRSQASAAALEQFDIAIVEDRVGQMLRNELLTMMHPRGARRTPQRFTLRIVLAESRQDLAIRRDETATRANLTLAANFAVLSPDDPRPLYGGTATSVISHNILTSDYATIAARADARERGVRQIAHSITNRLSVWLLQTGGRPIRPADDGAATGVPASPAGQGRPGGRDDPDAAGIR